MGVRVNISPLNNIFILNAVTNFWLEKGMENYMDYLWI